MKKVWTQLKRRPIDGGGYIVEERRNRWKKPREEEKKNKGLYVRFSETDLRDVEMASYEFDESMSDLVRKACKMYINARRSRF